MEKQPKMTREDIKRGFTDDPGSPAYIREKKAEDDRHWRITSYIAFGAIVVSAIVVSAIVAAVLNMIFSK